ncbi:hypothetical protein VE03_00301 [Pseudogymnoascus sp. 23342-1-I1]|nr:hypothetical protein VE03_00301 [Pseudogymnoascus sp. 23342-1-I1]
MPRIRTRYHHSPIQHTTPPLTPTPTLKSKLTSKLTSTLTPLRRRLNSKLITGTLLLLLSLLSLLILIKTLPSLTPWPTYQPLPSEAAMFESFTPRSTPRAPHNAVRKTLTTISALVKELNGTLATTCPGCIWRTATGEVCVRSFYDDGDIALVICGTLIVTGLWIMGMLMFLKGVVDIAPPLEVQVRNWGLGGATVAAAVVVFVGLRAQWYWWVLFVLGAAFGGMVFGVFVTREELVEKWREEVKTEAESSTYTEPGTSWGWSF